MSPEHLRTLSPALKTEQVRRFDGLSDEVVGIIFEQLGAKDYVACSAVSKRFHRLIHAPMATQARLALTLPKSFIGLSERDDWRRVVAQGRIADNLACGRAIERNLYAFCDISHTDVSADGGYVSGFFDAQHRLSLYTTRVAPPLIHESRAPSKTQWCWTRLTQGRPSREYFCLSSDGRWAVNRVPYEPWLTWGATEPAPDFPQGSLPSLQPEMEKVPESEGQRSLTILDLAQPVPTRNRLWTYNKDYFPQFAFSGDSSHLLVLPGSKTSSQANDLISLLRLPQGTTPAAIKSLSWPGQGGPTRPEYVSIVNSRLMYLKGEAATWLIDPGIDEEDAQAFSLALSGNIQRGAMSAGGELSCHTDGKKMILVKHGPEGMHAEDDWEGLGDGAAAVAHLQFDPRGRHVLWAKPTTPAGPEWQWTQRALTSNAPCTNPLQQAMLPVQGSILGRDVEYAEFVAHLALPGALLGVQPDPADGAQSQLVLHVPDAAGIWRHQMLCAVATEKASHFGVDISSTGQFASCISHVGEVLVFDLCAPNSAPRKVIFPDETPKPRWSILTANDASVITLHDGPSVPAQLTIGSFQSDPLNPPTPPSSPESSPRREERERDRRWMMMSQRQGRDFTCTSCFEVSSFFDVTVSRDGSLFILSSVYDLDAYDFNG